MASRVCKLCPPPISDLILCGCTPPYIPFLPHSQSTALLGLLRSLDTSPPQLFHLPVPLIFCSLQFSLWPSATLFPPRLPRELSHSSDCLYFLPKDLTTEACIPDHKKKDHAQKANSHQYLLSSFKRQPTLCSRLPGGRHHIVLIL